MKILFIGGTRFFGKHIIHNLLSKDIDVTVLNRGNNSDNFGNKIKRLIADRRDYNQLQSALADSKFDIVIDQVCYSPLDAQISAKLFKGRIGRYLMTSSIAVYHELRFLPDLVLPLPHYLKEERLDLSNYPYNFDLPWNQPDFFEDSTNYIEGKRQAETILLHHQDGFPATTIRLAHVLSGHDDFTERFPPLINKIKQGEPIVIHENPQKSSFITRNDAAKFFPWLVDQSIEGPINAASFEQLSVQDLCLELGKIMNKEPIFMPSNDGPHVSYSYKDEFSMSTQKARDAGFQFAPLHGGLKEIVDEYYV